MDKIDIVYLWVDGADKKWLTEKNKWQTKITGKTASIIKSNIERYRDNDELKYSLRSLSECAPWINHIYIITGFNQVPKWLKKSNKKITIVPHEKIFPNGALPTFNSTSIEMCIDKIEDLSEHFLLANDDIFFNKPLKPSFFYTKRGQTYVRHVTRHINPRKVGFYLDNISEYRSRLVLSARTIEQIYNRKLYKYAPSHGIDAYLKSSWIECRNHPLIKPIIDNQIFNKFRTKTEIQRWIFNLYNVVHKRGKFCRVRPHKSGHNKFFDTIYNIIFWFKTRRSTYTCPNVIGHEKSLQRAAIFCINDSESNTPEILTANKQFLQNRFPNKSEFEK